MDDAVSDQNPRTRTMPMTEVKRTLSRLVDEVKRGQTRVLIEESGVPAAVLVSVGNLERLAQLDRERAARWQLLEAMREPFRGIPPEEIEREAAKAIAEVRAKMRDERNAADRNRDELFDIIDEMREAFTDVPPDEIERNAVAIVRQLREADQAAIDAEDQATIERRPA